MSDAYNNSWNKFLDKMGENQPEIEVEFSNGWEYCKEECLKILKTKLQNADLSEEFVDSRYIDMIKLL